MTAPAPTELLPQQITGAMACILEDCGPPEMQSPEVLAELIRHYQPTWDALRSKLLRQAASVERADTRESVIEECARELETSYPDHAAINAYCAAVRSLKTGVERAEVAGEAVAWLYEVDVGHGWSRQLSLVKPSGNELQRNITPLYASSEAERYAKIADDFAAYEQTVLDRAFADDALSETGRKNIVSAAGSRQVAAEQIAHDIRSLASPPRPEGVQRFEVQSEVVTTINARLTDLAEANALYGKDQRLSAPDKIARNEREISWLKDLRSMIALSAAQAAPDCGDEDHPDCTTARERELYDALMVLGSAITARQGWSKWVQGGVQVAPIVHKALRLDTSSLPSAQQKSPVGDRSIGDALTGYKSGDGK